MDYGYLQKMRSNVTLSRTIRLTPLYSLQNGIRTKRDEPKKFNSASQKKIF